MRYQDSNRMPGFSMRQMNTSPNLEVDDLARHAFDYFRFRTYGMYIQRGYPVSWADCALSAAVEEPAIFYAIAANGAAERALTETVHATLVRRIDQLRETEALELYCKALRCLQVPTQNAIKEDGPLRPIILSCLFFLVFETTVGSHTNAIRHIRSGNKILNERLTPCQPFHNAPHGIDNREPRTVKTGAVAAAALGHGQSGVDLLRPQQGSPSRDPCSLSSQEISNRLEALIHAGEGIRAEFHRLAKVSAHQHLPSEVHVFCLRHTVSRVVAIDAAAQKRATKVLHAFHTLGQQIRRSFLLAERLPRELLFLQIRRFHASFTLAMSRGLNEKLTDCFTDEIARTLRNIERLIGCGPHRWLGSSETEDGPVADNIMRRLLTTDRGHPNQTKATLAGPRMQSSALGAAKSKVAGIFEFGILPALFMIACKCRKRSYRRRAVQLLYETERVEAVNSSRTLSVYADAVVLLEERTASCLVNGSPGRCGHSELYADQVPNQARFLDVVASGAETSSAQITLGCTRLVVEASSDIGLLQHEYDPAKEHWSSIQVGIFSTGRMARR